MGRKACGCSCGRVIYARIAINRIGREMHSLKALIDRAKGHIDTRWMLSAEHGTYGQFGITEESGTAPIFARQRIADGHRSHSACTSMWRLCT